MCCWNEGDNATYNAMEQWHAMRQRNPIAMITDIDWTSGSICITTICCVMFAILVLMKLCYSCVSSNLRFFSMIGVRPLGSSVMEGLGLGHAAGVPQRKGLAVPG